MIYWLPGAANRAAAEVVMVNPLLVVEGKKLRLTLDLRVLNKSLAKFRFRCDGLEYRGRDVRKETTLESWKGLT